MSKYFKTIDRLSSTSWADSSIRDPHALDSQTDSETENSKGRGRKLKILRSGPSKRVFSDSKGLSKLTEGIRALAHSKAMPGAVLSDVGGSVHADSLLNHMEILAARAGITLCAAEFQALGGSRLLRLRNRQSTTHSPQSGDSLNSSDTKEISAPADLNLSYGWTEAERWVADAAKMCDLLLIKAPPILESVDGALLAKIAGGLVLVVELQRTTRADLVETVGRAKSSDCPILGIVAAGPNSDVPEWLVGLISPTAIK